MSTLQGKLRQKSKNGQYYYRLFVAKGIRKEFALRTNNLNLACEKTVELDSIWLAPMPDRVANWSDPSSPKQSLRIERMPLREKAPAHG